VLQEIRELTQMAPFRPFTLYLADGRKLEVPHPDFVWLPRPGVFYFYHEKRRFGERINPLLIVSVESENREDAN